MNRVLSFLTRDEKGASLIESLMVIMVVSVIVLLMANLPNAMNLINKSKHLSLAREIAIKALEDKRAISFTNLVNDTAPIVDSRISLLPEGSGTVTVEDCSVQICKSGESIKKVVVTVSWTDNQNSQTVNLNTFIGEGGLNQ